VIKPLQLVTERFWCRDLRAIRQERLRYGGSRRFNSVSTSAQLHKTIAMPYGPGCSAAFAGFGQCCSVFGFGILVVLSGAPAQYESYVHPGVILMTVPLRCLGAGLFWPLRSSDLKHLIAQVGLASPLIKTAWRQRTGILICGGGGANIFKAAWTASQAAIASAESRLAPSDDRHRGTGRAFFPLVVAHSAGAQSQQCLGTVIFGGPAWWPTVLSLGVVPPFYVRSRSWKSDSSLDQRAARSRADSGDHCGLRSITRYGCGSRRAGGAALIRISECLLGILIEVAAGAHVALQARLRQGWLPGCRVPERRNTTRLPSSSTGEALAAGVSESHPPDRYKLKSSAVVDVAAGGSAPTREGSHSSGGRRGPGPCRWRCFRSHGVSS